MILMFPENIYIKLYKKMLGNQNINQSSFTNYSNYVRIFEDTQRDKTNQRRCAFMLTCLSLTVILDNLLYIVFDIIYNGLRLNIVFSLMIIEIILFGYYLSQIKNGMVSHEKFTQVRKVIMITCILYILYFIVTGVILILINTADPDIDPTTHITIIIISPLIFLLPRFIGLCATKNVSQRSALLIANR